MHQIVTCTSVTHNLPEKGSLRELLRFGVSKKVPNQAPRQKFGFRNSFQILWILSFEPNKLTKCSPNLQLRFRKILRILRCDLLLKWAFSGSFANCKHSKLDLNFHYSDWFVKTSEDAVPLIQKESYGLLEFAILCSGRKAKRRFGSSTSDSGGRRSLYEVHNSVRSLQVAACKRLQTVRLVRFAIFQRPCDIQTRRRPN